MVEAEAEQVYYLVNHTSESTFLKFDAATKTVTKHASTGFEFDDECFPVRVKDAYYVRKDRAWFKVTGFADGGNLVKTDLGELPEWSHFNGSYININDEVIFHVGGF